MRHLRLLLAAAVLTAAAVEGGADEFGPQRMFDAGVALGSGEGGRELLAALADTAAAPDEMLVGIAAGLTGTDRLRELLDGTGAGVQQQASAASAAPPPASGQPPLPGSLPAFGSEGFWIRLGDGSAPGIYMLADPACPHCASALDALAPDISEGRLHVRMALVPVVSEASTDLAAMIMIDPEPAQAAWTLLLAAAGGAPLPDASGSAGELGELGEALIGANLEFMRRRGLSAVPHFMWSEGGRWTEATGVQDPSLFAAADRLENGQLTMHAPEHVRAMVETERAGDPSPLPE